MAENRDYKGLAGIFLALLLVLLGAGAGRLVQAGDVTNIETRIEKAERDSAVLRERVDRYQETTARDIREIKDSLKIIEQEMKNP